MRCQTIAAEAPVLDMIVAGAPALLLFTHEDRPLDRAHLSVEGLDSGVIVCARHGVAARARRRSTIRDRASAPS